MSSCESRYGHPTPRVHVLRSTGSNGPHPWCCVPQTAVQPPVPPGHPTGAPPPVSARRLSSSSKPRDEPAGPMPFHTPRDTFHSAFNDWSADKEGTTHFRLAGDTVAGEWRVWCGGLTMCAQHCGQASQCCELDYHHRREHGVGCGGAQSRVLAQQRAHGCEPLCERVCVCLSTRAIHLTTRRPTECILCRL